MRNAIPKLGILVLAIAGTSVSVEATTLYDNGAPDHVNGSRMSDFLQADDFTLGSASTVTDVSFWDLQFVAGDYIGSIYWAIYSNVANAPGAILFGGATQATVTRTDLGAVVIGGNTFEEFKNDFNIGSNALAAGTYWLALHDGPLASNDPGGATEFDWETTHPGAGNKGREEDLVAGTAFASNGNEHAFLLSGTTSAVPEPGTLALLGVGCLGLGLCRRKRSVRP